MALTWRQRRALRAIERALAEQDPQMNERLSAPPDTPPPTVADWIGWTTFAAAVLLLVAGLALVDLSMVDCAVALLCLLPPLVLLVAAGSRGNQ